MGQRRFHYEHAFEAMLRRRRLPYICVDEAKKAHLPEGARLTLTELHERTAAPASPGQEPDPKAESEPEPEAIKSFDFVVYDRGRCLLIDVKGRKIIQRRSRGASPDPRKPGHMESWVTEDDVRSLVRWRALFGDGYDALFVFLYWCDAQPPDGLYQEVFEHRGRWYALRAVELDAYRAHMTQRSPRWRTVHLPTAAFERLSEPFRSVVAQPPTRPRAVLA
jgi:hypothetical protein